MTLQPRDRWVIQRVAESFSLELSAVEEFFRDDSNLKALRRVYTPDGPKRVLVYYQPRPVRSAVRRRARRAVPGPPRC